MGIRRSGGRDGLKLQVEAASQRQAYNNFRKVRVLYGKIVDRTPVLSGELRANWHVGYGKPDYSFKQVSKAAKKTGGTSLAKPVFSLSYDPKQAWKMYISNGTPYAGRVEHGWSNQAPAGMLRLSVLEVFGFGIR